jgi:hypothetical protein
MELELAVLFAPDVASLAARAVAGRADAAAAAELDAAIVRVLDDLPFGAPFTFAEQYGGAVVHDVRPREGHETEQSSRGRVKLELHTDDAFLGALARPRHLALIGVSNPDRVPTLIARLDDLLELLDSRTVDALSQPWFHFPCPQSFDLAMDVVAGLQPKSVLSAGSDGRLQISLAPDTAVAALAAEEDEEEAERHLELLWRAVDRAPCTSVALSPGELLVVSNSRCLHGRPPVSAERWIKRVYMREDLSALDCLAATGSPGVYAAANAL